MSEMPKIQPNLQFIQELQAVGCTDLKKCYQCATCSVICPLSPADAPYPRKEMVWAQWGLKDKLINDIDIWLCHNCGDCSDLCPRGAKPGDLLSALRNMSYRKLVRPKSLGKWMSSPKYLPILFAIPAILYAIIWFIRAKQLGGFFPLLDGKVVYGHLFPGDYTIDPVFCAVGLFMVISFIVGIKNLFDGFKKHTTTTFIIGYKRPPTLLHALFSVLKDEILTHKKWRSCGKKTADDTAKMWGHLTLFYGFVALFIVTTVVAITHWGGKLVPLIAPLGHTPMPLLSPVKILANIGAVLLLIGLSLLTKRRLCEDSSKTVSSYYDWYLLGVIWVVTVTGILAQIFRLQDLAVAAYSIYYLHLISVFMLIAYLPWSKLGHLVYRTAALVYARYIGRLPISEKLIKQDDVLVL